MYGIIRRVKGKYRVCQYHDAIFFDNVQLPVLVDPNEYNRGDFVLYFETAAHPYRNQMFRGMVYSLHDAGLSETADYHDGIVTDLQEVDMLL